MSATTGPTRALLSVSDKTGLVGFARRLGACGVELISTGGTARTLVDAGLDVTPGERVTGAPEMLDGRVKTLHPAIHGAILADLSKPDHAEALERQGYAPIDVVCVNLYPFEKTAADPNATRADLIENIDVGGPTMIRAAAKNHARVFVVIDPSQYDEVARAFESGEPEAASALRERLAVEAFARLSRYDTAIAARLGPPGPPDALDVRLPRAMGLRYGENPHQQGAFYAAHDAPPGSIAAAEQLHGKELSYNNIADADAAWSCAGMIARAFPDRCAAVVIKHKNPCGAATAEAQRDAVDAAVAGDPRAAYGGIIAVVPVGGAALDAEAAGAIADRERFFEVVIAPGFTDDALSVLRGRSKNLRLLATGAPPVVSGGLEMRSAGGGVLAQTPPGDGANPDAWEHKAGPEPDQDAIDTIRLLDAVIATAASNTIAVGGFDKATRSIRLSGLGCGQVDRVGACRQAIDRAGPDAPRLAAASDAFFPFDDGPRVLVDAGVRVIAHPGGSKRDGDTLTLCEDRGVACLLTGLRRFRH